MFSRIIRSLGRPARRRDGRRTQLAVQQSEMLENRTLLSSVTVTLGPSQDGTLYENTDGAKANGAGSFFFVGANAQATRRGLLKFDVAGAVPEGAVITDVTLTLHNSGGITNTRKVTLHPVDSDWGTGGSDAAGGEYGGTGSENGDATWVHTFHSNQFWSTPGGDFGESRASTKVMAPGFYEWSGDGMIANVQEWLDDPDSNNGWLLRSNEGAKSVKRFDSGEHKNPSRRPELSITYELAVSPTGIEGRKWHDENVNGFRDPSEPWLNGWTIELYDADTGELVETTVTDDLDLNEDGTIDPATEVGVYTFTTTPGTYEVREVLQPGWAQSYPGFASDIGSEGKPSASGGMSLSGNTLYFDFDVDVPNGASLAIDFFVPDGNGGLKPIQNRPAQRPVGEDRVSGSVDLTPTEIAHLLDGSLTSALVNGRMRIKAQGPVRGSGSHIVTVSSGELVTGRDFGNYRLGNPQFPGPIVNESDGAATRGIHFGMNEIGQTTILIAPQSIAPDAPEGESEPFTPRQVFGLLNYIAKRDAGVAAALDRLFAGEDPLDLLV